MAMPYISPALNAQYRQDILLFAKGAPLLECISAHYLPDRTGVCDLTGAKEQEELFVLANRSGATRKFSRTALQIIANVLDIEGVDEWHERLKEQKKTYRDRMATEAARREEERKASSRTVLVRKKSPSILLKSNNS